MQIVVSSPFFYVMRKIIMLVNWDALVPGTAGLASFFDLFLASLLLALSFFLKMIDGVLLLLLL